MKSSKIFAVIFALIMPAIANADDNLTSRQVISMYRGDNSLERLNAITYAIGLGMGYLHASVLTKMKTGEELFCFPPKLKINAAVVVSTLEQFVKENPEAADQDAAGTLAFAFAFTFPCKKA